MWIFSLLSMTTLLGHKSPSENFVSLFPPLSFAPTLASEELAGSLEVWGNYEQCEKAERDKIMAKKPTKMKQAVAG